MMKKPTIETRARSPCPLLDRVWRGVVEIKFMIEESYLDIESIRTFTVLTVGERELQRS